jgi:hypothetical protein
LAAFSTAFDLTALRRLAVLDAAAAAVASAFGAVTRDDAFLLFFISAIVSSLLIGVEVATSLFLRSADLP